MTTIVQADFEHSGRLYTAHGTWEQRRTSGCAFAPVGRVVVQRVVLRGSGVSVEPIEGGGLHRAASAAISRAARKDS